VEKARRFGATDQEIREAIAVVEVIAAGQVRNIVAESSSKPQGVSQSKG